MNVNSFPPVIDARSRILILGSMPGVASLKAHRYYWNHRNYMWRILYRLFGDGREPDEEYDSRITFALSNGIALWDVIASCDRKGSLDSEIKQAIPNDIPGLLERYPNVKKIACNGTKSFAELNKHYGEHPEVVLRTPIRLPSTSPIPTRDYRGLEDRLEAWKRIKET
ncbi:DNA-deoxyinosine glycosylase [Cohnella terricola]|uniref:DNA-deoxyinosine glycosylase n=1 Tax=Cohnella terricola TaxID=1289167 RepID=A0A559JKQ6_9BACL|nr:DNA-deoxyinosine glycosylase [Cohnella terricola]TVY00449.1 DNA-deoxyinosine glycosylase [Cohnella terricola]